jgi:carboxylesterase type B
MAEIAFDENLRMTGPVSEDCVYLNVWTAANSAKERRPVVVWIPGGGFVGGSASFRATDSSELAGRADKQGFYVGGSRIGGYPGLYSGNRPHQGGPARPF